MTRLWNSLKQTIMGSIRRFYLPLMLLELLVFAVLIQLKHLLIKPISEKHSH